MPGEWNVRPVPVFLVLFPFEYPVLKRGATESIGLVPRLILHVRSTSIIQYYLFYHTRLPLYSNFYWWNKLFYTKTVEFQSPRCPNKFPNIIVYPFSFRRSVECSWIYIYLQPTKSFGVFLEITCNLYGEFSLSLNESFSFSLILHPLSKSVMWSAISFIIGKNDTIKKDQNIFDLANINPQQQPLKLTVIHVLWTRTTFKTEYPVSQFLLTSMYKLVFFLCDLS